MQTILELKNINKVFKQPGGSIVALKRISFKIKKGQCVGLIGPSGSGKSTLLHIAGLLDKETSGEIYINNNSCHNLSEEKKNIIRKKHIGFVYQNFYLLNDFSAIENVIIPQILNGEKFSKAEIVAKNLLSNFGLSKRLYNKPKELSGGEKQRVALSRAIANKPDIILADEPTGNLDSKSGLEILKFFDQLHKAGNTIIVVTHEKSIAKRAKRRVELFDGKITLDE